MTGRSVIENGLVAEAVSPTVMTAVTNTASAISPFRNEVRSATVPAKANFVPELTRDDRKICREKRLAGGGAARRCSDVGRLLGYIAQFRPHLELYGRQAHHLVAPLDPERHAIVPGPEDVLDGEAPFDL